MSTPDKRDTQAEANPPATGINAWKGGLAGQTARPPAAASAPPLPQPAQPAPSTLPARTSRAAPLYAWGVVAAVLAAVALGIWALNYRHATPPRTTAVERAFSPPMALLAGGTVKTSTNACAPVYRALVIGINRYDPANGAGWQPLQSARPDAEALAGVLKGEYGFQVRTLLDAEATRGAVMSALDELAIDSGENDAVLVYFAGHGYYDDKLKEGYWIPADARRTANGREAKEDWLWNSTLTRLFGAANARHVLVLADACYSGSLFRGDEPLAARGNRNWYERAFAKRSRYLITSGSMEPVLDSGGGHSVFAQQVLNYLGNSDHDIFSANDLGLALRDRVSALTGQMVQMGPLPVSEHAGGEFVFVRKKAGVQLAALPPDTTGASGAGAAVRGPEAPAATPAARQQEAMRDALSLVQAGAPKAANHLVSVVLQQNAQDHLAQTVAAYVDRARRQEGRDELQALIAKIEAHNRARSADASKTPAARPRVLACLGPTIPSGVQAPDSSALLYRVMLSAELADRNAGRIVEREALASILQEQQIGASDLADPRARTAIGKLLPASLLLLGDLFPLAKGDKLVMRLVDVETSSVLGTFQADRPVDGDVAAVCAELAGRIADRIATLRPLLAPVTQADGAKLRADFGAFQGGRMGMVLRLVARLPRDPSNPDDFTEQEAGTATVRALGDFSADLEAAWSGGSAPARTDNLWVREIPPSAKTAKP